MMAASKDRSFTLATTTHHSEYLEEGHAGARRRASTNVNRPSYGASSAVVPTAQQPRRPSVMDTLKDLLITKRPSKKRLKEPGDGGSKETGLFGSELGDACGSYDVPLLVIRCCEAVEKYGRVTGIYRLSGTVQSIDRLREAFEDVEAPPDLDQPQMARDIHCVASVLKLFFRELPVALFYAHTYTHLKKILQSSRDSNQMVNDFRKILRRMAYVHYKTAEYLLLHLQRMTVYENVTGMDSLNMAIVWAPNLFSTEEEGEEHEPTSLVSSRFGGSTSMLTTETADAVECSSRRLLQGLSDRSAVVNFLVQYASQLFGGGAEQRRSRTMQEIVLPPTPVSVADEDPTAAGYETESLDRRDTLRSPVKTLAVPRSPDLDGIERRMRACQKEKVPKDAGLPNLENRECIDVGPAIPRHAGGKHVHTVIDRPPTTTTNVANFRYRPRKPSVGRASRLKSMFSASRSATVPTTEVSDHQNRTAVVDTVGEERQGRSKVKKRDETLLRDDGKAAKLKGWDLRRQKRKLHRSLMSRLKDDSVTEEAQDTPATPPTTLSASSSPKLRPARSAESLLSFMKWPWKRTSDKERQHPAIGKTKSGPALFSKHPLSSDVVIVEPEAELEDDPMETSICSTSTIAVCEQAIVNASVRNDAEATVHSTVEKEIMRTSLSLSLLETDLDSINIDATPSLLPPSTTVNPARPNDLDKGISANNATVFRQLPKIAPKAAIESCSDDDGGATDDSNERRRSSTESADGRVYRLSVSAPQPISSDVTPTADSLNLDSTLAIEETTSSVSDLADTIHEDTDTTLSRETAQIVDSVFGPVSRGKRIDSSNAQTTYTNPIYVERTQDDEDRLLDELRCLSLTRTSEPPLGDDVEVLFPELRKVLSPPSIPHEIKVDRGDSPLSASITHLQEQLLPPQDQQVPLSPPRSPTTVTFDVANKVLQSMENTEFAVSESANEHPPPRDGQTARTQQHSASSYDDAAAIRERPLSPLSPWQRAGDTTKDSKTTSHVSVDGSQRSSIDLDDSKYDNLSEENSDDTPTYIGDDDGDRVGTPPGRIAANNHRHTTTKHHQHSTSSVRLRRSEPALPSFKQPTPNVANMVARFENVPPSPSSPNANGCRREQHGRSFASMAAAEGGLLKSRSVDRQQTPPGFYERTNEQEANEDGGLGMDEGEERRSQVHFYYL